MFKQELGRRIRESRMELGLSGTELARRIGKSQPYISDLERGLRTPSLPTLQALADALEKPVSYFLAGDAEPPSGSQWPERTLPHAAVEDITRAMAEHTVDQLLTAGLLSTDRGKSRDELVQIVHRAIRNAYIEVQPASRRRPAGSAVS